MAYDNPGTAADNMRTTDQLDLFNGAPDRYDWKLVGKREVYVPYNSYRLQDPKLKNKDLITGVPKGTIYHQVASGGGGYGDPAKRDRKALREEVRNGVISKEAAVRDYGMTEAELKA